MTDSDCDRFHKHFACIFSNFWSESLWREENYCFYRGQDQLLTIDRAFPVERHPGTSQIAWVSVCCVDQGDMLELCKTFGFYVSSFCGEYLFKYFTTKICTTVRRICFDVCDVFSTCNSLENR